MGSPTLKQTLKSEALLVKEYQKCGKLSEALLVKEYQKCGKLTHVQKKYCVSVDRLKSILEKNNIQLKADILIQNHERAYQDYIATPMSFVNDFIETKLYNIFSKKGFIQYLESRNAPIRDFKRAVLLTDNHYNCFLNIEDAYKTYKERGCMVDVAKKYNIPHTAVKSIFRYARVDIPCKRKQTIEAANTFEQNICDLYSNDLMLMKEIAKKYQTSSYYVRQTLLKNGIRIKTKKEATTQNNNTSDHQHKAFVGSCRTKSYTLPSGDIINVQGYEDHFLDFVFSNKLLAESEIQNKDLRIPYTDTTGKLRHYYPDFYIPKFDLIIEIKSAYTLARTSTAKVEAGEQYKGKFLIIIDKDYSKFVELIKLLDV